MSEEGKKRKAEDDRDGDSNVNGGATGPELSIPRTHTFTYKRHNLKYSNLSDVVRNLLSMFLQLDGQEYQSMNTDSA